MPADVYGTNLMPVIYGQLDIGRCFTGCVLHQSLCTRENYAPLVSLWGHRWPNSSTIELHLLTVQSSIYEVGGLFVTLAQPSCLLCDLLDDYPSHV